MPDLVIELRPSVRLRTGLVALHLLATAVVWWCDLPTAALLLLSSAIAISLLQLLRQPAGRVRRLERHGARWSLVSEQGTIRECSLAEWFVHPRLMVLVFRGGNRRRDVVALPDDAARADELRRLRCHLLDRQRMEQIEDEAPGA